MTASTEPNPSRRLRWTYILGLSLVALLSILAQVQVQLALREQEGDGRVINLAGRQRMLSQKLVKSALALRAEPTEARHSEELREALELWSRTHRGLVEGDTELGLPGDNPREIEARFEGLEPIFVSMREAAEHVLAGRGDGVAELQRHEGAFLTGMNEIVFAYDAASRAKVEGLRRTELALLALTLLVLLGEALLVFEPAARALREQFARILAQDEKLALMRELEAKTAEVERKNAELEAKTAEVERKNAELEAKTAEVERKNAELRKQGEALEQSVSELEEANRLKSEFIGMMSHEFRTPMHAILGYVDLVDMSPELDDTGRSYLGKLRGAGEQLLRLIEDLLSYSRLQAGQERIAREEIRLGALLTDVEESLAPLVKPEVEFKVVDATDQPAFSDASKLRQILVNLVGNALKFTERGAVTLTARTEGLALELEVSDTGPGIAPEDQATVFEAFRQADGSATRSKGGTGLGLAITSSVTRLLGGRIKLESKVGAGTTFRVRVPLRTELTLDDPPEGPEQKPRSPPATGVWIAGQAGADALLSALDALETSLAVQPLSAKTVERLQWERPRVIVVDLTHEPLPALAFLAALRASRAGASVATVVVAEKDDEYEEAIQFRPSAQLTKPVDQAALLEAVEQHLGTRGCVLVVDDAAMSREVSAALLRGRGYVVETAVDGHAALAVLAHDPLPDLVVLDLFMPGMTGFEVLAHIAADARLRVLPVIVFSGTHTARGDPRLVHAQEVVLKGSGGSALLDAVARWQGEDP